MAACCNWHVPPTDQVSLQNTRQICWKRCTALRKETGFVWPLHPPSPMPPWLLSILKWLLHPPSTPLLQTAVLETHQIKAIYNQYCTESLLLNIPRSKAKTALLNNIIVTSWRQKKKIPPKKVNSKARRSNCFLICKEISVIMQKYLIAKGYGIPKETIILW